MHPVLMASKAIRAASITGSLLISDMVGSCMLQCRDDLMGTPMSFTDHALIMLLPK